MEVVFKQVVYNYSKLHHEYKMLMVVIYSFVQKVMTKNNVRWFNRPEVLKVYVQSRYNTKHLWHERISRRKYLCYLRNEHFKRKKRTARQFRDSVLPNYCMGRLILIRSYRTIIGRLILTLTKKREHPHPRDWSQSTVPISINTGVEYFLVPRSSI